MPEKDDVLDEARAALLGRLRDPLVLGYAVGFVTVNWRFFYTLVVPDGHTSEVLAAAASYLAWQSVLYPIGIALFWAMGLPYLTALGVIVRRRASILLSGQLKKMRQGTVLTAQEWQQTEDFLNLSSAAAAHEASVRDYASALPSAWRASWPRSEAPKSQGRVLLLHNSSNGVREGFGAQEQDSLVQVEELLLRQLSIRELQKQLVYVFSRLPASQVAVAVERGGLVPWPPGNATHLWLNLKGSTTAGEEPEDAIAVLSRLAAPHQQWGRFEILSAPRAPAPPMTPSVATKTDSTIPEDA